MGKVVKLLEIRYTDDEREVQNAYDHLYDTDSIRHQDSFYRWILGLIRPKPGKRLLDVACGQGIIPEMATASGVKAYGIDLSLHAIRQGHNQKAGLLVANGQALPYRDGTFDYITNIGSLEHYVDPPAGIREMVRLLAPAGLACILLPNTFSVGNILNAWHEGRTTDNGQPIQRYATQFEWQDLLEANGLIVTKTVKYEYLWPTSMRDMIWYLKRPKALIRLLVTPFVPLNLANCFVFLCHRAQKSGRICP